MDRHKDITHNQLNCGRSLQRTHTHIPFSTTAASVLKNSKSEDSPWAGPAAEPLYQLETGRGGVRRSSSLLRTAATYEKRHNTE